MDYIFCQIQLVEKPRERPCLVYKEDISKNCPGGLKGRKNKPKVVVHHANLENPRHCFVRLFKNIVTYVQLTVHKMLSIYLAHGETTLHSAGFLALLWDIIYTLKNFVANLCKVAGIHGYKTNNSLNSSNCSHQTVCIRC